MFTHPDELQLSGDTRLVNLVSSETYEKIQKARYNALSDFFHKISTLFGKLIAK